MNMFNIRPYVAEMIGTFLLAAGVAETIGIPTIGVPTMIIAGLILGTVVYTIGAISGAHINPAVTLSLWSVGKIKVQQAIGYILSQLLGGFLALLLQTHHYPVHLNSAVLNVPLVAACEMLGAFILVWGVSSVVYGKVQDAASGLTIGASLTIGAMFASMGSFGILNPAVAIGLGVFSPVYLLAPIIGGMIAAQLYRYLVESK
jgi:glycerol uptake facilitator-like aquaporin